jgi:hypothetical protein
VDQDEEFNVVKKQHESKKHKFYLERQKLVDQDTRAKWTAEQNELKKQLVEADKFDWQVDNAKKPNFLKYVSKKRALS